MKTAAVLLAAGASTRMGTPKQLLPYRGTTLIRFAAMNALASECESVHVVLGAQSTLIEEAFKDLPVNAVVNEHWLQGIGSSIRCGVKASTERDAQLEAVLILLADQPYVTSLVIDQFIDRALSSCTIVAASYHGTVGVPALFHQTHFAELLSLPSGSGAKRLIERCTSRVEVPLEDAAQDIDTMDDYALARREGDR